MCFMACNYHRRYGACMLLLELVKTASMRVELWRARRERARLRRSFPPPGDVPPALGVLVVLASAALAISWWSGFSLKPRLVWVYDPSGWSCQYREQALTRTLLR